MNYVVVVRSGERFGNLPCNRQRLVNRQRADGDAIGQRWPFDQFEDERRA